uniref:Uncharacterized protein n=1 Tax=Anguilla anguilla TaxID=7936 RepID=A0A0E9U9Y2_ANGAN
MKKPQCLLHLTLLTSDAPEVKLTPFVALSRFLYFEFKF